MSRSKTVPSTKAAKRRKPYENMTAAELAEATKEFDRSMVINEFKPLTPEGKKIWERLKRKRGGQQIGEGCQKVLVTVERGLLRQADALAKRLKKSRAALVSDGLRAVLAANGATTASGRRSRRTDS